MDPHGLINLAVIIFISLIIFLICREIVCWYFKINEIVALLAAMKNLLRNIVSSNQGTGTGQSSPKGQIIDEGNNRYRICEHCREKNNPSLSSCWKCDAKL